MPKFILEINLGNDGMRTGYDVAHLMRDVAYLMQDKGDCEDLRKISRQNLRDINGNVIGHYEVV